MRRNRGRAFLVLLAAGALTTGLPAAAEGLPKRFEFGRIALGAPVRKVPRWAFNSDCNKPETAADCGFWDPDGVSYTVFDGFVCTKTFHVDAKTKNRLPYGIKFKSTKSEVVAALSKKLKLKFTNSDSRTFESGPLAPKVFDGSSINLRFDRNNRLASIELWSLCT